ncbi:hypothetical protein IR083_11700 [Dysgonomonas sp. GY75]|uniref:hypothetical protein n=1 Tax=Dysgonomonas sp. GY75 TaxID=2780419 RepID=UPI00188323FE|nr:hypothetical protein [Dysgonomonas sp. GY75]MBF0649484.1 hypothetical protein [Dysgonomonas sp. GY75]
MNINKTGIILLSLLGMLSFSACSNDDSDFDGGDSYITAFRLKQGDVTLNASISQNTIVVTAPENLLLSGATANVLLSENAKMEPDPATITDWDTDQSFVVTAYNGTKSTYNYHVERNVVSREGDVILLTQAEVDEFATLGLARINGSLTIGAATGADSVYSLKPLAGLRTIDFNLIINPTFAGNSLEGLENLERVGSLQIGQVKGLKTVDFAKLGSIMTNLAINGANIRSAKFPELKNIDRALQIQNTDSLVEMSFPKLQNIVENMTIQGSWNMNKLAAVDFPKLEKIGGNLNITQWKEAKSVNFPILKNVTTLSITSLSKMESLALPQLGSLPGDVTISACDLLVNMDITSLKTISGNLRLENVNIEDLKGLKSLESVGKELFISNMPKLKSTKDMKSLKSVGGRIYISSWPVLEDNIDGLSLLNSVGGDIIISQVSFKKFSGFSLSRANKISLYGNNLTSITEVDLRNINMNGLELYNITTPFTLKGKDICGYDVTWGNCNIKSLEGFKELKSLNFTTDMNTMAEATISVEKIQGNLSLSTYGLDKVSLPNLKEVGGMFYLSSAPKAIELPLLKKTGTANIDASSMQKFSMPVLETIDGDCAITSGGYNSDNLSEIDMPKLTTVNGSLNISGYSSYYGNSKLTNLNGFRVLKNVKEITVSYNSSLSDFSGLKDILSSVTASSWNVFNNAYNPTYQDMLDGKYKEQ